MAKDPAELTQITTSTASIFNAYEQTRMERFQRFLVHCGDPDIAVVLAQVGFDAEELGQAWTDWDTSVGRKIPFALHLAVKRSGALAGASPEQRKRLADLDAFENTWFVRCRNAIRRFVVASERQTFEEAFFQNLEQQPEGPGVIGSVDLLLDRIDATAKSQVKGAAAAHAALQKKGLSKALIKQMRELVSAARGDFDPSSGKRLELEQVVALAQERREAYERLNAWYIDWSDAIRTHLTYHQAVRLGITEARGGHGSGGDPEPTVPTEPTSQG